MKIHEYLKGIRSFYGASSCPLLLWIENEEKKKEKEEQEEKEGKRETELVRQKTEG